MTISKFKSVFYVTTLCMLASPIAVQANTIHSNSYSGAYCPPASGSFVPGGFTRNEFSSAAHYNYVKGLKAYQAEKYNKAEKLFEKVLQVRGFDKEALHYLVAISMKKDDKAQAVVYAKRWARLDAEFMASVGN